MLNLHAIKDKSFFPQVFFSTGDNKYVLLASFQILSVLKWNFINSLD